MFEEEELIQADRRLVQIIDAGFAEAKRRAGDLLACRPGCGQCCHGMIPVNKLDVSRLRRGMAWLRKSDPDRWKRIVTRAGEVVAVSVSAFPGDVTDGVLRGSRKEKERFFERHSETPCPAMDPSTEYCEVYDIRPVACRAAGPPISFGGSPLPHCELCFIGASEEEIGSARVDVDPEGLEMSLLLETGLEQSVIPYTLAACSNE